MTQCSKVKCKQKWFSNISLLVNVCLPQHTVLSVFNFLYCFHLAEGRTIAAGRNAGWYLMGKLLDTTPVQGFVCLVLSYIHVSYTISITTWTTNNLSNKQNPCLITVFSSLYIFYNVNETSLDNLYKSFLLSTMLRNNAAFGWEKTGQHIRTNCFKWVKHMY